MALTAKTAAIAAALTLTAAPAFAIDGTDNPGTSYQQTYQPSGTPDQTSNPGTSHQPAGTPTQGDTPGTSHQDGAPYSGDNNPGTTQQPPTPSQARALGRNSCAEFKTNFKQNRSAFGKCIAAVAKALRNDNASAKAVCDASNLTRKRLDGQKRSDFKACALAVAKARKDAAGGDS
jgi:hypothetical protein